jgi:hypothetical protein
MATPPKGRIAMTKRKKHPLIPTTPVGRTAIVVKGWLVRNCEFDNDMGKIN